MHKMLYMNLKVTTNQKCVIDTKNKEKMNPRILLIKICVHIYVCVYINIYTHLCVYYSIIYNNHDIKANKMSYFLFSICLNTIWQTSHVFFFLIYIIQYYLGMKKNEILPFTTTWMDLEGTMLSKISQSEKDKYHMISLTCGI